MDEVEKLILDLKNPDPKVREKAVEALGKIKDARAVPALIEALKDEDWGVQSSAAWVLGRIGDVAVPSLIKALKDEDWQTRGRAAEALGEVKDIKDARVVPALIRVLKDKDEDVRCEAAEALGEIKDARAVPALIKTLKDENKAVRRNATEAIANIGEPAVPYLIEALGNEDLLVRRNAGEVLRLMIMGAQKSIQELDNIAVEIKQRVPECKESPFYEDIKRKCVEFLAEINARKNELLATQIDIKVDAHSIKPPKKLEGGVYRMQRIALAR